LAHGLANDAFGIAGRATINQALTPGHQITEALPFLAIALIPVIWQGSRLAYAAQAGEEDDSDKV
jgi:hypothetical protein